jgi:hypothetical protein
VTGINLLFRYIWVFVKFLLGEHTAQSKETDRYVERQTEFTFINEWLTFPALSFNTTHVAPILYTELEISVVIEAENLKCHE